MDNDKKSTITGVVTGLLAIASWFGVIIPADYIPVIVSVGFVVLGYFTNKKDK